MRLLVLFLVSVAWAYPSLRRRQNKEVIQDEPLVLGSLRVPEDATLSVVNSPRILLTSEMTNLGSVVIRTNHMAKAHSGDRILYTFRGNFVNDKLFVVQIRNPREPVHVNICGGSRSLRSRTDIQSTNDGAIILLSSKAAALGDNKDFQLSLYNHFANVGSISVLGTRERPARLIVDQKKRLENQPALLNMGLVYLKDAILYQEVTFSLSGCIILGEGATLVANSRFGLQTQHIHFLPGAGTAKLVIKAASHDNRASYSISNFPHGSSIHVDKDVTRMVVSRYKVTLQSILGDQSVDLRFELEADSSRFVFEDGVLTHSDDLWRTRVPGSCAKIEGVKEHVDQWETSS